MSAGVRRIIPLTLGWEDLPKSVSVEGAPDDQMLREPVPGVLLQCDGGWLLLDTGFNTALITDPALRARFHGDPLVQPVLPGPGEPLAEALDGVGRGPGRHPRGRRQPSALRPCRRPASTSPGGCRCTSSRLSSTTACRPARARGERHLPGRLRRPADRLARCADGDVEIAPGVTGGTDRRAHSRPPELRGPDGPVGGRRGFRVRVRRGRPDREHRAGGRGGRADRRLTGTERGADPQAQADRCRVWLPGRARARPGSLARVHRRAGQVPGVRYRRPGAARDHRKRRWPGPHLGSRRPSWLASPPGRCRRRRAPAPSGGRACRAG